MCRQRSGPRSTRRRRPRPGRVRSRTDDRDRGKPGTRAPQTGPDAGRRGRGGGTRGAGILQDKSVSLNAGFFLARAAFYFGIWLTFAYFLNRWSADQDRQKPAGDQRKF